MEQGQIKIVRQIKRKIQSIIITKKSDKIYASQSEEQLQLCKKELARCTCLFITHAQGGGTYSFEKENFGKNNNLVVLRRLHYSFMEELYYRLELCDQEGRELRYIIKWSEVRNIFDNNFDTIIVNSLVTYQYYQELLRLIIDYRCAHSNCVVKYFVHDFHAVCPNVNLYKNSGYCNLECEKHQCKLKIGTKSVHIDDWRKNWAAFLEMVDEIRCFSESSKAILQKAYPKLDNKKITVKPHDTSYCTYSPITNMENLPLCVGIVGAITSDSKGKSVVSKIIRCYGHEIPIRIIGTKAWRYRIFRKKVKYLGPYKRDELREILKREKVTFVVFPSLWPETFSYLISELMAMDIPIVCFNYGAQAEKVSKYHKGTVCANVDEMCMVIEKIQKEGVVC